MTYSGLHIRTNTKNWEMCSYLVTNYLLSFKPASFYKNGISGQKSCVSNKPFASFLVSHNWQAPSLPFWQCQGQPSVLSGPRENHHRKYPQAERRLSLRHSTTATQAHLAFMHLWFPLKQVVLHTSYYSSSYVTSRFQFVGNLISLKTEPRYWFFS